MTNSTLGWYWLPLATLWFFLLYLVALASLYYYPDVLNVQDEEAYQGHFIAGQAVRTLLNLTEIGPKVVGSAASEKQTVFVILNMIDNIKQSARKDLYDIEHEVQVASGSYGEGKIISVYQNIQNIIVKVKPKNSESDVSLLLNSHFDSAIGSPGAGDDGLMVAVMLETLRVITTYETPINSSIVFLFNGAEEVHLLGSHAFITQHKWAKNISAVINLDSAGSGGREMLFRAGPGSWVLKYYGSYAAHPFASTLADELYQHHFIPSETDFTVFKEFGLSGLDMASMMNGYVYHTKNDRFNEVPRGAYQSTGDNVLALTKALASAPEMNNPEEQSKEKMVFFDVLGWFFISYTEREALLLNIVVCILAVLTILAYIWNMANQTGMLPRRVFAKFGILLGIQFGAVIVAVVVTIALAFFLDAIGLAISWYSQTWMIFGLYFCPIFFVLGILPAIYLGIPQEDSLPLSYAIQLIMHAHCLFLVLLTVVFTSIGIRSVFLVMISVEFYTVSVIINIATGAQNTTFLWLISHIVCQFPLFLFYTYNCNIIYPALIPIAGRSSSHNAVDLSIAGVAAFMGILIAAFLVPIFWLFQKSKLILSSFALFCGFSVLLAVTSVGFPYLENELGQRFVVQHTTRTFHNGDPEMSVNHTDAGFYVLAHGRRTTPLDFITKDMDVIMNGICDKPLLCGLPKSFAVDTSDINFWAPGPPPQLDGWPAMKVLSKQNTLTGNILYKIEVTGPDSMVVYIRPKENITLVDWYWNGFDQTPPSDAKSFLLLCTYGVTPSPFQFNLEFENVYADWSGATFDLVVVSHRLHDDNSYTDDFLDFLARFPSRTVVSHWLSSYELWTV